MAAADTLKEINVEVKRCPDCGARFGIDSAFCPFDGIPLTTSTWDKRLDPRCSSESGSSPLTVGNRYEVLEPLGEGGMGTVYKVRHITLDRYFAMKVLRRDLATDANLATRFLQEARATAAIKHPSVVAITDFGEMEDGIPYFVMELLEGEILSTRIRARGSIEPGMAILIAKQIAEGLAASHDANVIHRDLKPENVFLVGRSVGKPAEAEIRIVDFGAAKIIGGSKLTRPGIVFGTPYYMSPEQASGQEIDGRADVYSLGVLLYEMITGRVPFEADTYMGVLTKHMFEAPARPSVPLGIQLGALEDVVMRALQKEPDQRYASMTALIDALEAASVGHKYDSPPRSHTRSVASPRTVRMKELTTADRIQQSVSRRVEDEARRRRRMIATIGLAAATTFASGAAVMSLGSSSSSSSSSSPPPMPSTTTTTTTTLKRATATATTTAMMTSTAIITAEPIPIPTDTAAASAPFFPATAGLAPSPPAPQPFIKRAPTLPPPPPPPPPPINTSVARPHNPPPPPPPQRADDFKDPWKR